MSESKQKKLLSVPPVKSVRYKTNYIKTAVCELRFPTLLAFDERLPPDFQKAMRKEYPHFDSVKDYDVSMHGAGPGNSRYVLKSKERKWIVSISKSAISLETSSYTEFSDFRSRLAQLLNISVKFIDSDFFTRVGLRYINWIPVVDEDAQGWLNPDLVTALISGCYGTVTHYKSEVRGDTADGSYFFRYGLQSDIGDTSAPYTYVLDYDYFIENVEAEDVMETVTRFNQTNFSFFHWCLGPKARNSLGDGTEKSKG